MKTKKIHRVRKFRFLTQKQSSSTKAVEKYRDRDEEIDLLDGILMGIKMARSYKQLQQIEFEFAL